MLPGPRFRDFKIQALQVSVAKGFKRYRIQALIVMTLGTTLRTEPLSLAGPPSEIGGPTETSENERDLSTAKGLINPMLRPGRIHKRRIFQCRIKRISQYPEQFL